ncbi:MAG: hypothetical protein ACRD0Z_03265 [Acidimicrobiales bacterium]
MTTARRSTVALLLCVLAVVVGLITAFAPSSSASPFLRPETRVAAIATPESQVVGVHDAVLPGQHRERSPGYDQNATGSSVAAEGGMSTDMPGYSSFRAAKADLGSPGPGNVFDHVVEQSQIGRSGFPVEDINNPFNLDPVDAQVNQLKANYYSSIRPFTGGQTVRDWLTGQSFADQYNFGMRINGLLQNGQPLP